MPYPCDEHNLGHCTECEVERLKQILRDAYEVWAGSEQIVPVYASEAYLLGIIEQMKDEVKRGL